MINTVFGDNTGHSEIEHIVTGERDGLIYGRKKWKI